MVLEFALKILLALIQPLDDDNKSQRLRRSGQQTTLFHVLMLCAHSNSSVADRILWICNTSENKSDQLRSAKLYECLSRYFSLPK